MTSPRVFSKKKYSQDQGLSIKESVEDYAKIREKRWFMSTGNWFPKDGDDHLSSTYRDSYIPLTAFDLTPQLHLPPSPTTIRSPTTTGSAYSRISPAALPPAGKHLTLVLPPGKKGHKTLRKPLPLIVSRFERAPVALFPRDEVIETAMPETPTLSSVCEVRDIDDAATSAEDVGSSNLESNGKNVGRRSRPGSAKLTPLSTSESPASSFIPASVTGYKSPSRPKPPQLYIAASKNSDFLGSARSSTVDTACHRRSLGVLGSRSELSAGWKDNIDILTGQVVSRIANRSTYYAQSESEMRRHFPDAGPVMSFTKLPPLAVS
ncbi:hypothetical protein HDU67_008402 [Dinochytrium kinnereticum]|nr:hypothetical protein HDU67_008402 [Dinochytrium kinnereticum]